MLKYNDKVIVVKDEENRGFYEGFEGRIMSFVTEKSLPTILRQYITNKDDKQIYFGVYGNGETIHFREDQLQK